MGALLWIAAIAAAAVCVRLGFWQLSRLAEKRALNAAIRQAEHAPALAVSGEPPPAERAVDRMLLVRGHFDEAHQFLLSGRFYDGEPGVEVLTPLHPEGSATAILVNRGWLPADDQVSGRPQNYREPGARTVRGVAEGVQRGAGGPAPRRLEADGVSLWSLRRVDADSIARWLSYPVAPYMIRDEPGPGVPDLPRRSPRPLYDETMHIGYAIQWFLISVLILAGTAVLTRPRRRAGPLSPEATS